MVGFKTFGHVLGASALLSAPAFAAPLYTITELPNLAENCVCAQYSRAFGMNDEGAVVGQSSTADGTIVATLWQNGIATELGMLNGTINSVASGINDEGQIVGTSEFRGAPQEATLWQNGAPIDLGGLGDGGGQAIAVNNSGQIVGISHAQAILLQNGAIIDLGESWGGGQGGYSSPGLSGAINASGQIAGQSAFGATLWENGTAIDLNWPGGTNSAAYAINAAGQIVGAALNPNGTNYYDAAVWQNGEVTFLADLGYQYSQALDINDSGQIVGFSLAGSGSVDATLWQDGGIVDLSTLIDADFGPVLEGRAVAINDSGQIVVDGTENSDAEVFLLTPATNVPEPSTLTLLGMALAGLAAFAGCRRA